MWKNVLAWGDVNDNLGMMSRQMMDEWQYVKSSQCFIYIHMYIYKESQTADQKGELQTFVVSLKMDITNFCSLKKRTYQDITKFCSLKDQEYYMPEKQSQRLKKRTLPSFVVSKAKDTTCQKSGLQTFVVWKSRHYQVL